MFDCVYPTRTARFGVALISSGTIRLKAKEYACSTSPVDPECICNTCKYYSRGIIHTMLKENNALACQLLTVHNISYMMTFMRTMRQSIIEGPESYTTYINVFISKMFLESNPPDWVVNALNYAGITLININRIDKAIINRLEIESNSNITDNVSDLTDEVISKKQRIC